MSTPVRPASPSPAPPTSPHPTSRYPKFKRVTRDPAVPAAPPQEVEVVPVDAGAPSFNTQFLHIPIISTARMSASVEESDDGDESEHGNEFNDGDQAQDPESQEGRRGQEDTSPQGSREGRSKDAPPLGPPVLKVTRKGKVPDVTKWFQARVAAQAGFDRMVISSPNFHRIPEYPRESSVIETFDDGRWGKYEYSLFPQDLCRGWWHLACIPLPERDSDLNCYHDAITPLHWVAEETIGFNGLGYIKGDLVEKLTFTATCTLRDCETMKVPAQVRQYIRFLGTILRVFLDRMAHIPAVPSVAIAVAAHVQRVGLELEGLKTYIAKVVPRLESGKHYSKKRLDVVGAFVREATDAATLTRVGIPVFYLRPLTHDLDVWQVVYASSDNYLFLRKPCCPPIYHSPKLLAGVSNMTGSWQRNMVLAVSGHLGRSLLGTISLAEVPATGDVRKPPGEDPGRSPKRARLGHERAELTHLGIRVAEVPTTVEKRPKKTHRGRRRGKVPLDEPGSTGRSAAHVPRPASSVARQLPPQPAKTLVPCSFYDLPAVWEAAILAVSPVPQSSAAALYFYPPPFLLDSVPVDPYPGMVPEARKSLARVDDKVVRYVHNFARIRPFCRARILDPHLSNEPLTISDWRAALWGNYRERSHQLVKYGSAADHRRAQRRQHGHNEVGRLLSRVASIPDYEEKMVAFYDLWMVDLETARKSFGLRELILWECHEINFRAELMALDTVLVHKAHWQEAYRWHREGLVSQVWGPPATVTSVVPRNETEDRKFRWSSSPADAPSKQALAHFLDILQAWPKCPEAIVNAAGKELDDSQFTVLQTEAVAFYVRTFVSKFARLPIAPIPHFG